RGALPGVGLEAAAQLEQDVLGVLQLAVGLLSLAGTLRLAAALQVQDEALAEHHQEPLGAGGVDRGAEVGVAGVVVHLRAQLSYEGREPIWPASQVDWLFILPRATSRAVNCRVRVVWRSSRRRSHASIESLRRE